jgi:hypothetical protein
VAIETLSFTLRAWDRSGKLVPDSIFFEKLQILPEESFERTRVGIELFSMSASDFSEAEEPWEAFAEELRKRLFAAKKWLQKQPTDLFATLRKKGLVTDIFIDAWIDSDQFDLDLPPEFLSECGKHGLTLSIVTND